MLFSPTGSSHQSQGGALDGLATRVPIGRRTSPAFFCFRCEEQSPRPIAMRSHSGPEHRGLQSLVQYRWPLGLPVRSAPQPLHSRSIRWPARNRLWWITQRPSLVGVRVQLDSTHSAGGEEEVRSSDNRGAESSAPARCNSE